MFTAPSGQLGKDEKKEEFKCRYCKEIKPISEFSHFSLYLDKNTCDNCLNIIMAYNEQIIEEKAGSGTSAIDCQEAKTQINTEIVEEEIENSGGNNNENEQ